MSNHIHAMLSTRENELSGVVRDFKGFTSKAIVKAIHDENESRREWMLQRFVANATRTARNENYKVWTHDNHPLQMQPHFIMQRVNYIHQALCVPAGWMNRATISKAPHATTKMSRAC